MIDQATDIAVAWQEKHAKQQATIDALVEALEYYANPRRYLAFDEWTPELDILGDVGRKAKEALKLAKEQE